MPRLLKRTLSVAVFVNVVGALTFFPSADLLRRLLGIPLASTFYLLLVSYWLFLFAGFFWWMLRRDVANEGVLLLSALGKLSFAALIVAHVVSGQMGVLMLVAAIIDGAIAVLFLRFVGNRL